SVARKHKPESYGASATERSSAPSRGVLNLSTRSRLLFPSLRPFDGAQDRLQPESWRFWNLNRKRTWMPAFAGMTNLTSPEGEGFQTSPRETLNLHEQHVSWCELYEKSFHGSTELTTNGSEAHRNQLFIYSP